ncbi:hypothetical protein MYCTH_2305448 [Thermothelomyces thermophilus ATCC 42464]|uniref:Uncharacterized protein n=1 Tax=Thermothelomyces thermophilus (strain ATCC 42464 / BCRC 31852 / DSM 1799) TaxID=573729 RepID=G2QD31_THET4|nr:uncharacterized protein MYCTH_2305448 [Thermothelomyces thermophilus ATCC 42464]AEO58249.1 hypothetical protein MYCTH_2305448 [Thermothelomyces thermophilus ATCC 42464]
MLWHRALVASFLATGARAGVGGLIADGLSHSNQAVERRMDAMAEASLQSRGYLEARQDQEQEPILAGESNTPLNADGSLNMEEWNNMVDKACQDALRNVKVPTNPSGTCVCYNLPLLNNRTGAFEADLRLYQLGEPTGDFQGVPQKNIEVELSYNGASVTPVNPQGGNSLKARQEGEEGEIRMLQSYMFVGQIDKDKMSGKVTRAQLEAWVMPVVTLKAIDGTGKEVKTLVSTNEAAFVVGEFANDQVMTNQRLAELAVEKMVAGLENGTVAFVLPGVQLLIFPIGLIITSIWLALGLAAYGFGTYERYNFREAHKRRVALAQKGGMPRI